MNYIAAISVGGIVTICVFSVFAVLLILGYFFLLPAIDWWKALFSSSHIAMKTLFQMKTRKTNVKNIVKYYIFAKREGIIITPEEIESHIMSGGNIESVLKALVASREAGLNLTMKTAKAVDLSGRDILYLTKSAISPIIVETGEVVASTRDGVEVVLKGTASLKGNIHRFIGGVDENTLMSRIVEGIITTVGSAKSYDVVLENPDLISETVEEMGLDQGAAFEIVSVDILSATTGKNIMLKFDEDRANSEAQIKKAESEVKLGELKVKEQEGKTKISEMRARLLEAEAEVPKAFAKALNDGKLGALDYYEMQNIANKPEQKQIITSRSVINSNAIDPTFNSQRIIRPIQNRIIRRPGDGETNN